MTLLSGDGAELSEALVRSPEIGALAFVGGRDNGGKVAARCVDTGKRHMLEQEGLNAWGIWEFSDWDGLAGAPAQGLRVRQAALHRVPAVRRPARAGRRVPRHVPARRPLDPVRPPARGGADGDDRCPQLDFGPLITAAKADELRRAGRRGACDRGAVPLYRGSLDHGRFLPGQDTSAYVAPTTLLAPPGRSRLMHAEPFGPVDTIVVVDTEAELLAQMNASNGALVASIACDDQATRRASSPSTCRRSRSASTSRARAATARSRSAAGARRGRARSSAASHLVHAVTTGTRDERLYGNFPDYVRYPAT